MVRGMRVTYKQALGAAAVTLILHIISGSLAFIAHLTATAHRAVYAAVFIATGALTLVFLWLAVKRHSQEMEARYQAQQNAIADFMKAVSQQMGVEAGTALDRVRGLDPRD